MNKTIAGIIISLLLAITGCIVYFVFIWSRPSKKSGSTDSTAAQGTTSGTTSTGPATTPADIQPGESVSSSPDTNPDLITVTLRSNAGGSNTYNFDTDPNHFNAGDSIFALEQIVIFDEEENPIEVQKMEMIGYFISRDISSFSIDNNEVTYKVPGINKDKEIAKLINN
jgi:hypothetical protein